MMRRALLLAAMIAAVAAAAATAFAGRVADVRNTLHNLSASGPGTVKAVSETQICVFCHTPHAATPGAVPLWNRKLSGATYTVYTSSSLDANVIQGTLDQPGSSSKLCLSCHDGTLAIGNVNVLNGLGSATEQGTVAIPMTGTGPGGTMPAGAGASTGFTRNVGTDLTNDHPISLTYTSALAARDGELRNVDGNQKWPPGTGTVIGVRGPGYRPMAPLEPTGAGNLGQVQCGTCHDPHLRETDATQGNQKFLRLNRFQEGTPGASHNPATDILCLACHDKNLASGTWAYSAHANPLVATQTYLATPAAQREFPTNLPVWKAACLNCHDTHTVQGARRLAREGTDSLASPKAGGASAVEETCYQCHSATPVITNAGGLVPNIKSEFARAIRMPITNTEQGTTSEAHDIGGNFADVGFIDCTTATNACGKDFIEQRAKLGVGNLANRHAECSDCHNPHRVVKFRLFTGAGGSLAGAPDPAGTHTHTDTTGYTHTNILSGVLRGAWGVQPIYGLGPSFQALPSGYTVKRGDPGNSIDTSASVSYATREYQICLKCHSDYGYNDNNTYPTGNRPNLGRTGGTPAGSNNLTQYTNQAKEFQAPIGHKGQPGSTADSGAGSFFSANNHRSWHPVIDGTGRSYASATTFRAPWGNARGTQTMYCSDCHGANTAETSVVPPGGENGTPWGPHGSENNFLLKGLWNTNVGADNRGDSGPNANGLCFKCHNPNTYANRNGTGTTGFSGGGTNLHALHTEKVNGRIRCVWCHVAVPHGWKNKALLVNLNDVGPEAGQAGNAEWRMNADLQNFNQQPYYLNAKNKIRSFATSGNWIDTNCGSRNTGPFFGANPTNDGTNGRDWMRNVCNNPP